MQEAVRDGTIVLVLGAGASKEATDEHGNTPPMAGELADKLRAKFLGGDYEGYSLSEVSELAISESNLGDVQDYIASIFNLFQPGVVHRTLATFRWHGIATTNYDLVLERAYDKNIDAAQTLVPFLQNGDRVDERLRRSNPLPYLKLHGCITRTRDTELPLILTPDQYVEYRKNRSRLFDRFKDWAGDHPVVFAGYRIQDSDFRAILLELDATMGPLRPRYYAILPSFTETQQRFWEGKKITLIKGKFGEFVDALDKKVTGAFRGIRPATPVETLAIAERFASADTVLSENARLFLENDVAYVRGITAVEPLRPRDFYRGVNPLWSAIEQNLDVRRRLVDTLLSDHFLADDIDGSRVALIHAHAGAGKTVLLQRTAWDAAKEHNRLCLYLKPTGAINSAAIVEIAHACAERIYLFVDDILQHASPIERLLKALPDTTAQVTLVAAARSSDWATYTGSLPNYLSVEYELRYLTEDDVETLVGLLERHKALFNLECKSAQERRDAFIKRAGRQLLVALHEATLGMPFSEIIQDEYRTISPPLAKAIYTSICVMFRFNVPVRAGIISRIHNIMFSEFSDKFLGPLQNIVRVLKDETSQDYYYVARHPHIADIVFLEAIKTVEERYGEYLKCLDHIDIDYSADRRAFNQLIRAKALLELFPDPQMVYDIFELAVKKAGDDHVLLHQRAIYEMQRSNGNLTDAHMYLLKAKESAPRNTTIDHSLAELALRRAKEATSDIAALKYLEDAAAICRPLIRSGADSSYARHTLVKVGIFQLQQSLKGGQVSDDELAKMLSAVEKELSQHLAALPGDPYLLTAEADLAEFLAHTSRATASLEKAFNKNPRNTYVALALARVHRKKQDWASARAVLEKALEANATDRRLHYLIAKVLWESNHFTPDELLYHSLRSYTPGDTNYDGQLLHARQVYVIEGYREARKMFVGLANARVSPQARREVSYPLPHTSKGDVVQIEATYCFIRCDSTGEMIYAHETNVDGQEWPSVMYGTRVEFRIGFTMRGPTACDVRVIP
jgi:Flp pilus assembly protein TadD/cold shock CspA family protein